MVSRVEQLERAPFRFPDLVRLLDLDIELEGA
jgi:hypothetical protein